MTRRPPTHVYFAERDGCVKIGCTSNVETRVDERAIFGCYFPPEVSKGPVRLLALMPGGWADEAALHRRFVADRLYMDKPRPRHTPRPTEWFRLSDEIREFVDILNTSPHLAEIAKTSDEATRLLDLWKRTGDKDYAHRAVTLLLDKLAAERAA